MLNKLSKLLKYEFRFYFRILPPIYLIIMLLALIVRIKGIPSENIVPGQLLLSILLGAIIIAMSVLTIILIIQRYTDNFLKEAGSLMFSLPVSVFALLASKVIAALCMVLIGFLSIVVSVAINTIGTPRWDSIIQFIQNNPKNTVFSGIASFSALLQQICLFYTVITVSYMLPKLRNLAAFAMYFIAMSFIQQHTFSFLAGSAAIPLFRIGLTSFIYAAVFFCITWFLLKRSYNLE